MAAKAKDIVRHPARAGANLIEITRVTQSRGYVFGLEQKCCVASLVVDLNFDVKKVVERFHAIVTPRLLVRQNGLTAEPHADTSDGAALLLGMLAKAVAGLQEAAAIPVRGSARLARLAPLEDLDPGSPTRWSLALPSLLPAAASQVLTWAIGVVNALGKDPAAGTSTRRHESSLESLLEALRRAAPRGNNVPHMIHAAHDLAIPYFPLPMDVFQFGWGRRARLSRGVTETDATPKIGALVARNKLVAAAWLRAAEIPVPEHELAPTLDAALQAANRMGFPVVVKPADRDRGTGVTANLNTEDELRKAYARANALSNQVMVERHVHGKEFRLVVVNGRLLWAYERVPASVTGDGRSTIRELIAETNQHRRVGPSTGLALVAITLDDAMIEFLEQQGWTPDSVPADRQPIRLQRIPNNVGGGHMRAVFDIIHPDNAAIAERATRLLRLDIAGIDFLTPDISKSWREVGGWITEVNEQPQMSPASRSDIHAVLLRELVDGDGRVPVAVVLGDEDSALIAEVRQVLAAAGVRAGIASPSAIFIGPEEIAKGSISAFRAAHALVTDLTVEMIVLFTTGTEMLGHGIPFDRIDLLAISETREDVSDLRQFLRMVRPHLTGEAIVAQGDVALEDIRADVGGRILRMTKSPNLLAPAVCSLLLDRQVRWSSIR